LSACAPDLAATEQRDAIDLEWKLDASLVASYIDVIGDRPDRYPDSTAPPFVAVCPAMPAWKALLHGSRAPEGSILQIEHDMTIVAPLRLGDPLHVKAWIGARGDYGPRPAVIVCTSVRTPQGEAVAMRSTLVGSGLPIGPQLPRERINAPHGEPVAVVTRRLPRDLPVRYANVSGDHNPIHLDAEAARRAGFSGVIVQGLATMAIAWLGTVDALCTGDPLGVRRMRVRFSQPMLPGEILEVRLHQAASPTAYSLNARSGNRAVLKSGVVELARMRVP